MFNFPKTLHQLHLFEEGDVFYAADLDKAHVGACPGVWEDFSTKDGRFSDKKDAVPPRSSIVGMNPIRESSGPACIGWEQIDMMVLKTLWRRYWLKGIRLLKLSRFSSIFSGMALLPFARQLVLEMGFLQIMRKLIPLERSTSRKEKPIDEKESPR